ncbi:MAG: hypothetical protein KBF74_10695 [Ferruginibacter sp.]|nr:hypothetical protein [Ferruginibacter sp.]
MILVLNRRCTWIIISHLQPINALLQPIP